MMRLKQSIEKIPGGMMVVPLLLGALINTVMPQALRIGNFTEALFVNGASTLIALFLLCAGSQINIKSFGVSFGKGFTLLTVKWIFGGAVGALVFLLAGGAEGLFLGLAPIAVIAAMTNSNGGLYVALAGQYGKSEDKAAYSVLAMNDGPLFTMLTLSVLGAVGLQGGFFEITAFIGVLLPILIGFILGNVDDDMRTFLGKGSDVLIPFFAFALGMNISFSSIIEGGLPGIMLGVLVVLVTGITGYWAFKLFKWNPLIGAAEGSTAGNAVATPAAIATASTAFAYNVELATVQVAASVVTTAILLPMFVGYLAKRLEKKNGKQDLVTSEE
ncbi:2-keto-3-deoxygluconate permease [Alkalicoccobacillus murimartini]|uniref:2-keto-3-deoxygluconate permease n=2 Tax=Alkalicoccobacillus murimartini TaxID=171685 RepID=A0ABT9YHA4_9BACI|nr:2-keto-3-deoxygluconate permease [Alkalicoccobacillus murimartini]